MLARLRHLGLVLLALVVLAACGSSATTDQPSAAASAAPSAAASMSAESAAASASATESAAASTSTATESTAASVAAAPALEVDKSKLSSTLSVYNWSDYMDPQVLTDFETEYGVKVTVDVFDNNEDMIAKIRPGNSGYDVVFPSDYAVDIMIKEGLLAKLDYALLPNKQYMKPTHMDLYYDKGNVYSMPYNLGLTGLAYDKTKFDGPVDSWAAVFDPARLEAINGQVTMLDDERETPGAALKYLGKSLNDTEPADLAQAEEILKAQKPFLAGYDSSNISRRLASGEIVAGQIYNYSALQAQVGLEGDYSGNPNITFVVPKEGGTIWQDNMAVVADSQNQYTAHVFINWLMRPEVAAMNAEYGLGITPNSAAEPLLSETLQTAYKQGFAPDDEMLKRLEWIERNDKTAAFTDVWTAVKGE